MKRERAMHDEKIADALESTLDPAERAEFDRRMWALANHPERGRPALGGQSAHNSDDGFVFQSREACETGRRENDWSKAGYLPSACTSVSVTP